MFGQIPGRLMTQNSLNLEGFGHDIFVVKQTFLTAIWSILKCHTGAKPADFVWMCLSSNWNWTPSRLLSRSTVQHCITPMQRFQGGHFGNCRRWVGGEDISTCPDDSILITNFGMCKGPSTAGLVQYAAYRRNSLGVRDCEGPLLYCTDPNGFSYRL